MTPLSRPAVSASRMNLRRAGVAASHGISKMQLSCMRLSRADHLATLLANPSILVLFCIPACPDFLYHGPVITSLTLRCSWLAMQQSDRIGRLGRRTLPKSLNNAAAAVISLVEFLRYSDTADKSRVLTTLDEAIGCLQDIRRSAPTGSLRPKCLRGVSPRV